MQIFGLGFLKRFRAGKVYNVALVLKSKYNSVICIFRLQGSNMMLKHLFKRNVFYVWCSKENWKFQNRQSRKCSIMHFIKREPLFFCSVTAQQPSVYFLQFISSQQLTTLLPLTHFCSSLLKSFLPVGGSVALMLRFCICMQV